LPRISNTQIFTILFTTITPLTYIITPNILVQFVKQDSWLAVILAFFPGLLVIYSYLYIINNSPHPFPQMLETYLGKIPGKVMGLIYIFVFILSSSIILRTFISFAESNVLPGIPISIMVFFMLLPSFYTIRSGLTVFARVTELVMIIAFPIVLLLLLSGTQDINLKNLCPVLNHSFPSLALASLQVLWFTGSLMFILTLAYYSNNRAKIANVVYKVLLAFIIFVTISVLIPLVNLGATLSAETPFPLFSLSRAVNIGGFIRNIEVFFISIYILGIFVPITQHCLMACISCQMVFNLKDYRFLAAPISIITGFLSVLIVPNISMLFITLKTFIPLFFIFFYILLPMLLIPFILFKPVNPGKASLTES